MVIDNYRWRLREAKGEQKYDDFERRLAEGPGTFAPAVVKVDGH